MDLKLGDTGYPILPCPAHPFSFSFMLADLSGIHWFSMDLKWGDTGSPFPVLPYTYSGMCIRIDDDNCGDMAGRQKG